MIKRSNTWCFSKCVWVFLSLVASGWFSLAPSYGQMVNATLYGSVTDQSGAAIPGVHVTVTNQETGVANKGASDAAGSYSFPSLAPGKYNIMADKQGFKSKSISGIAIILG